MEPALRTSGGASAAPASWLTRPLALALLVAVLAAATLAGAWAFQLAGYTPCELCLKERIPYYLAVPVALATAAAAARRSGTVMLVGFGLLVLCFMAGAALGLYHAGVEMKVWAGPTGCSGAASTPADVGDFFRQLDTVNVVRCDEPALKILGLSLAVWNVLACLVLLALANAGLLRAAKPGGPLTAP